MGLWSDPSTKGRNEAGKPLSDKRNPLSKRRGGCQAIVNAYEGLPLDTLTINNIIADVRKVFTYSGIAHFLKRDVLVSILFEVDGGVSISTDISED